MMTPDLPPGLPPLPPVPEGFDRWEYRGADYSASSGIHDHCEEGDDSWYRHAMGYDLSWSFVGDEGTHVIEAVREPSAQLFATLDPENGEEADAFYARFYHPDTPDEMVEGASGDERRMVQRLERERFEWMDKTIDALAKVGVLTEAADYLNGRLREVTAQRDGLLGALESFIGRARMGEVNKGMFVRIEELEGLSAAIAAVKGGRDE